MLDEDGKSALRPRTHPATDGWRRLAPEDRMAFIQWVTDMSVHRQSEGRSKYGDTFQGDPLVHLAEELFDGLFYCFQAWRERAQMEKEFSIHGGNPTHVSTEYPH